MIHGLFLDPRIWKIDLQSSPIWDTEKYGIKLDLHPDAFHIPKIGVDSKYKFVLTTEVWEIPMRKTLDYLRKKGLKVFLMPRETFITDEKRDLLFKYPKFLYNGGYYFKPDVVVAPNKIYAGYWKGVADAVITGYPRFDYLSVDDSTNKQKMIKKYGLNPNKKILFFPSYPPYYHKTDGSFIDLYDAREQTLQLLEEFAKNSSEYQVVVKIHPMSFKCFKKGTGFKNEVKGTLLKYYKSPTNYMSVIGDVRMSGDAAKELMLISDAVVGFASTMLMEALAVDKPILHLLLGDTADANFSVYRGRLPTAYTNADALSFLNNPYKTDDKQLVEDYLCGADGKSCERICETIIKYLGGQQMTKPEILFVIGAYKSGTTSLMGMLNCHEDIYLEGELFGQKKSMDRFKRNYPEVIASCDMTNRPRFYKDYIEYLRNFRGIDNHRYVGEKIATLSFDDFLEIKNHKSIFICRDIRTWLAKPALPNIPACKKKKWATQFAVEYIAMLIRSFGLSKCYRIKMEDMLTSNSKALKEIGEFIDMPLESDLDKWWERMGKYDDPDDPKGKMEWWVKQPSSLIGPSKDKRDIKTEVNKDHPLWKAVLPIFDKYYNNMHKKFTAAERKKDLMALAAINLVKTKKSALYASVRVIKITK